MPPDKAQAPIAEALAACAAGRLSPSMALMKLLIEAPSAGEAAAEIAKARSAAPDSPLLAEVRCLFAGHREAWDVVHAILACVRHDGHEPAPREWAGAFDRAAAVSPEAAVALYSLGSPALLAAASAEIVALLRGWRLLLPGRRILDLGCGIGRLEPGLAEAADFVLGVEISSRMAAIARRRCASIRNVGFALGGGHDLGFLADRTFDLVVAADAFPYIVQSGGGAAQRMIGEARRVLRAGGDLAIFNLSYRGDPERDRRDVARWAGEAGLVVRQNGASRLSLWDGLAFHLHRPRP
jgi:SAM-dependent methyltransferase